jgi:lipid-A-disaccharide synthase
VTYMLGRPRVKVPYFAMVNLIAGEEVVTELVQRQFTVENVIAEMNKIIPEGPARTRMIEKLSGVRAALSSGVANDSRTPAERAARSMLELIRG